MLEQSKKLIETHIKTHTQRSAEDYAAVGTLEYFLGSGGRIITDFPKGDKWPNIDGKFEFVEDPNISRRPAQNFFAQIKGTHLYSEEDGIIKYSLKSLGFPAFIANDVTLDPGILFVVLNPDIKGSERVFWKYISVDFLNSIDFNNSSKTIKFTKDEEILPTEESVLDFCKKLKCVVARHSFVNKLSSTEMSKEEIEKIIKVCDLQICSSIDVCESFNRDDVSQMILPRLYDLCRAALLLNSLKQGKNRSNLQLAWEEALLNIKTKYLATFMKGLKYIDGRIPEDGQSERLMLKYYNFMWQIRDFLKKEYNLHVLNNLEKFPREKDELDEQYYKIVADAFENVDLSSKSCRPSRFYITKRTPFFVGNERFYEVTLQLAGIYATKYNRITAYTKENISTNYSVQISFENMPINLWGIQSDVKIITNWRVSIDPSCLNKLGKILKMPTKISSNYGEYSTLMDFLTTTGINFLELIDLQQLSFAEILDSIYLSSNTSHFKNILIELNKNYSKASSTVGANTIRYLLLNLKEDMLINVMPWTYTQKTLSDNLYLSNRCFPFERNPYISNLYGSNTSNENNIKYIFDAIGGVKLEKVRPYLKIKNQIFQTGEIYFDIKDIATEQEISEYNNNLDVWERKQGYNINIENDIVSIDSYERTTINILNKLLEFSMHGNEGQREYNNSFIKNSGIKFNDPLKERALREVFVKSHILLIYGAAGTGKTTLINYISNMMSNHKKLFLTKTHTAKQNLQRRIDNPGIESDFVSIDSFTKKVTLTEYDVIFVDECSTIDNRTMLNFLGKVSPDTFIVLAGDIHQIESIDFGNWFFYAKDIINTVGANIELLNTWRTEDENIINLWNEVRNRGNIITEILTVPGPFSEDIGEKIFDEKVKDEVVLCLNYDGKFGLNNMNSYFQNANSKSDPITWQEWTYKVGDHILFNDSKRFSLLYNNLKGNIVAINKTEKEISFTVDVMTNITKKDCERENIEFISASEDSTRIRFTVYSYDEVYDEDDEGKRMLSVIPFQLAYAVSIHKAQGLEYDSVKVIIPKSNLERVTHGIFYTAITRAKKKLKIYWSAEIMNKIVESFSEEETKNKSLELIKKKLSNYQ